MIVNDGKLKLLTQQLTYIAGLSWGLFTNNQTISDTTVLGDLTAAAWTGYAAVTVGTMAAATIVANKAVSLPNASPAFGNSSGSTQTFYGWYLYDSGASKLIAAQNIGSTTISNGATYPLSAAFSDNDIAG